MKKFYNEPEFKKIAFGVEDVMTSAVEERSALDIGGGVEGDDIYILFPGVDY